MMPSFSPSTNSMFNENHHFSESNKTKISGEVETDSKKVEYTLTLGKDDECNVSGVKLFLPGIIYQLKVLMLFVKRATHGSGDRNIKQFLLATEMDAAEKFDDVVFKYEKFNEFFLRFIQIKHIKSKITIADLKSTSNDNAYSLQKYFISYCKIMQNELFNSTKIHDLSILTNTDFQEKSRKAKTQDVKTLNTWEDLFEAEEFGLKSDEIFYFDTENFRAMKYKLKSHNDIKKLFELNLLESALASKELHGFDAARKKLEAIKILHFEHLVTGAEEAVANIKSDRKHKQKVYEGAKIVLKLDGTVVTSKECEKLNKAYQKLDKAKVNLNAEERKQGNAEKTRKDRHDGLKDAIVNVLTEAQCVLKKAQNQIRNSKSLVNSYKDSNSEKNKLLKTDLEHLEKDETRLKKQIKDNAEFRLKKVEENLSQIAIIRLALNDDTFNKYFDGFAKEFRFITNFPNEVDLEKLIKTELGDTFHLLNAELAYDSFQNDVLKFYKEYQNKKAKFLSAENGKDLFDALERRIYTLVTAGLSKAYTYDLNEYGINFDQKLLQKFKNQFMRGRSYQIVRILTSNTRLTAIKVLQTFNFSEKYVSHDSNIFTDLKSLLTKNKQEFILKSFKQSEIRLVIECQKDDYDVDQQNKLKQELLQLINPSKQIILICPVENRFLEDLIDEFYDNFGDNDEYDCKEIHDKETSFQHLDNDSQENVLKRKVNFQGKSIRFDVIINTDLARTIIDSTNLLDILTGVILIGDEKPFSSIGYVKDCFIDREFCRQWIKVGILEEQTELFFVTGINEQNLIKLKVQKERIQKWEENRNDYRHGIILPPPERNYEAHEKMFGKLGPKAYWLEYHDERKQVFLKQSVPHFRRKLIEKYLAQSEYLTEDNIKRANFGEKIIAVAGGPGMGKSIAMTGVARKIKGLNDEDSGSDDIWIVRFDLNDYADAKHPQFLDKINFNEHETVEAIDFVTKMAVPDDSENTSAVHLQREIFRAALESPDEIQRRKWKVPKIVILFDGFDEIIPGFRKNAKVLIKALRSIAAQIWVTTRLHEKQFLEQELRVHSFCLKDFNIPEQVLCLERWIKWHWKKREREIEELFEKVEPFESKFNFGNLIKQSLRDMKMIFPESAWNLLFKWINLIENGKEFTVVPLHLTMLAEVIIESDFELPDALDLFELYTKFVTIKLDIYKEWKAKYIKGNQAQTGDIENCLEPTIDKNHIYLSIKLIFSEMHVEKREIHNEIEKYKGNLIRVGLVTSKGEHLEFIHRSFAEYFFSRKLLDIIGVREEFPVEKILLYKDFRLVRQFLNSGLKDDERYVISETLKTKITEHLENCSERTILHVLSVEGQIRLLRLIFDNIPYVKYVNIKDKNGSTLLQLAVQNTHPEVVKTLVEFLLGKKADVNVKNNNGTHCIHIAAEAGHDHVVKILLRKTADINVQTNSGVTPLFVASQHGQRKIVETLLQKGANINMKTCIGTTPLCIASQHGHSEVVKILLKNGADINAKDNNEATPLHVAAQSDHGEVVKMLVKKGADINIKATNAATPLFLASENGRTKIVEFLLKNGADVNVKSKDGVAPLYVSVQNGHSEVVEILLKNGSDVNGRTYGNGATLLCLAAQRGHEKMMKLLVKNGADVNVKSKDGLTPLYFSAYIGHKKIVEFLVEKRAVVNDTQANPLWIAAYNGHSEVVEFLIKNGADVNIKIVLDGRTPLHAAAQAGHREIAEILLKNRADADVKTINGLTPLHISAECGHVEVMKALLEMGATIDAKENSSGATPLHVAAIYGHIEIVEILLGKITFIDATNNIRQTPLHLAAENGHQQIVETLVRNGANVHVTDKHGREPFILACGNGHKEVATLLWETGNYVNC